MTELVIAPLRLIGSGPGRVSLPGAVACGMVLAVSSSPRAARWRALLSLSVAELLALSLWFSASAVLPALAREWHLGDAGAAALTIAVQLGFILGTLGSALGNLPDVWSPRSLMVASCALGAVANAAVALWVDSLGPALILRFVTGVAMAGAYPPAMKIMATWFREGRGLAIGILIGALTVGSAVPSPDPWPHRPAVAPRPAGRLAPGDRRRGGRRGPSSERARTDSPRRASTCAWRARSSAIAALGWPASAISATCGSCTPCGRGSARSSRRASRRAAAAPTLGLNASAATFLVIAIGALGCWIGGWASDRWGRTDVDHDRHGGERRLRARDRLHVRRRARRSRCSSPVSGASPSSPTRRSSRRR